MKYALLIWILPLIMDFQTNDKNIETMYSRTEALDLGYLVREPKDSSALSPVLLLLHGYGSNENDLFSLFNEIPEQWLVISARAPFAVSGNQFKWYNVNLIEEKITINIIDEEQSRKALIKLIDQLMLKYKADRGRVVVAGFSQGANLAINLLLTKPDKIQSAACFSGRFMEEMKPLLLPIENYHSKSVFIAHGTDDNMLPITYAKENKNMLEELGINVSFSSDKIGHSISSIEISEFKMWLLNQ